MIDLYKYYWLQYTMIAAEDDDDVADRLSEPARLISVLDYNKAADANLRVVILKPAEQLDRTFESGEDYLSYALPFFRDVVWYIAAQLCAGKNIDFAKEAINKFCDFIEVYETTTGRGKYVHSDKQVDAKEFLKAAVNLVVDKCFDRLKAIADSI